MVPRPCYTGNNYGGAAGRLLPAESGRRNGRCDWSRGRAQRKAVSCSGDLAKIPRRPDRYGQGVDEEMALRIKSKQDRPTRGNAGGRRRHRRKHEEDCRHRRRRLPGPGSPTACWTWGSISTRPRATGRPRPETIEARRRVSSMPRRILAEVWPSPTRGWGMIPANRWAGFLRTRSPGQPADGAQGRRGLLVCFRYREDQMKRKVCAFLLGAARLQNAHADRCASAPSRSTGLRFAVYFFPLAAAAGRVTALAYVLCWFAGSPCSPMTLLCSCRCS